MSDAGISQKTYLAKARGYARKAGYDPKKLGFSDDSKHKLKYEDEKITRFGAVGLGDFIFYSLSEPSVAEAKRSGYLARARNIRGKWSADKHSPNAMAIAVLWAG